MGYRESNSAILTTALNPGGVSSLGLMISGPPAQYEVQLIAQKLDQAAAVNRIYRRGQGGIESGSSPALLQLLELRADGLEVWQIFRRRGALAVLDDTFLIDDERRACGGGADAD